MLSVVGKTYKGLIDDVQGGIRAGRWCVDQIFTLKQIGERAWEKQYRVYVGFMDLGKAYDRVNREAIWQVLRMYDVGGKLLNVIKSIYMLYVMKVNAGKSKIMLLGGEEGLECEV